VPLGSSNAIVKAGDFIELVILFRSPRLYVGNGFLVKKRIIPDDLF
jgi:hypothetical protein